MTTHDSTAFRLSPQQRLSWLTDMPAPSLVLHHHGKLNIEWLRKSLASFVERHESLRLGLQSSAGFHVPLQVISHSATAEKHIYVNDEQSNFSNTEFDKTVFDNADFDKIVVEITEITTDVQQLKITLPLLSADRGTLVRLAEALSISQSDSQLEEMTYTQYSTWLYELQIDEDAKEGQDYWKNAVLSAVHENEILYREEYFDQRQAPSNFESESIETSADFHQYLHRFCAVNAVKPSDVFITAWAILLQRLSTGVDNETPTINMHWVHDCRDDYDELSSCWGLFSKALPLHWSHSLEHSFSDALANMSNLQEAAIEWQEYYGIESDPAAGRYGFEFGGKLAHRLKTPLGPQINIVSLDVRTQPFELLLVPAEIISQQSYRLSLAYDSRFYSAQTIVVLLEQYQALLTSVLKNSAGPLKQHTLSSASFEKTLERLDTQKEFHTPASENLFPHYFTRQANKYKNSPALYGRSQDGDTHCLSYGTLEARSNQLAHHLISLGIGAETRVAIYLDRTTDFIISIIAVLKSGAAFLPLETQQPAARILAILEAATPTLILSSNTLTPPQLANIPCVNIESVNVDSPRADSHLLDAPPNINVQPHNTAYILFTSGSTGVPKGVIIEHAQLFNYTSSICTRINLVPGTKSALATSLAADLSYTLLFPALLTGGELHVVDRNTVMDPDAWAAYQTHHSIDHLKAVPSLVDAWLSHSNPKAVLPKVHLILGGETCSVALLNKIRSAAPKLILYNHYGPTETTVGVIMHKADPNVVYRQLPLSDRLDHIQLYLVNDQQKLIVPGQAAELYIGGPQLARGYLNNEQTSERFITAFKNQRLYRTGDLARYRTNGAIDIIGRADRQIKIRGFRIELDEIQVLLADLPDVRQAAVEAMPNAQGDLKIFAFVSLNAESKIPVSQLQNQLQVRLPDYMLPTIRLVEQLPLMANGKLDRPTLREWATKMTEHVALAPPRRPLEELLVELWAEVLGLEKVGIHDDFFKIGGHSLAAVKLASRIQKALTTGISVNAIFSAPTVAAFAHLIQEGTLLSPLVDLSLQDDAQYLDAHPNLFCLPPSNGHAHNYRPLAEQLASCRVWGLQASYLIDGDVNSAAQSIDVLTTTYVSNLREQQPKGPYYLLGWSLGGLFAISVAAQLEAAGEKVEFLGVVDTQMSLDAIAEDIETLIEMTTQELDAESQIKMRNLSTEKCKELLELLSAVEKEEWPLTLGRWAQTEGFNLEDDSWDMRLNLHLYVQNLIRSFRAPQLNCEINTWLATDTIDAYGGTPLDWHAMTGSRVNTNTIHANHMTILKQTAFHEQLQNQISRSLISTHNSNLSTAAATYEEVV